LSALLGLTRRELALLTAAFVLTLPAVTPRVYASDEIQYFSYLRSLWFDGDVSFENEYRYFYDRQIGRGENFHATFLELQTDAGRRPNFGTLGAALLWSPFYAAGDAAARVMAASGAAVETDGFSPPYLRAVAYGSALYGFLAIVLAISALRRITASPRSFPKPLAEAGPLPFSAPAGRPAPRSDVVAGLLVWVGTPLLFYMYIAPPYAHAPSAFAVALFVWIWLRVRAAWTPRGAIALGLSAALMAMVREQDALLAVGPALDFALSTARRPGRGALITAAAGALAFTVGYGPQLLAYKALNGYAGPSKLVVRKMTWYSPHALEVLFSTEHGFLFWTPLAVVAIAGLVILLLRGAGDARRTASCMLLMIAAQVYVSGSVESWKVAGAFGQRRFVAITVFLVIGLGILLRALLSSHHALRSTSPLARFATGTVLALCVWWNLALTALFGTGLMNRQRLELQRNAYDAFVTVPAMAPDLAARYLTRRESFYQRGQQP
jgi:hypothetical protein